MLINIDQVSTQLKLSKPIISRLVKQQIFPEPQYWTVDIINYWSRSKKGRAILKNNKLKIKYRKRFTELHEQEYELLKKLSKKIK